MNLTSASNVFINNKEVQEIYIDGKLVYSHGVRLRLSSMDEYVKSGETVMINVTCSEKRTYSFELFKVVNMTRTSLGTLTTDENGETQYTYTGQGDGVVSFVAEYENGKQSNTLVIDDYIPEPTLLDISVDSGIIQYGRSARCTVNVLDQHEERYLTPHAVDFYIDDIFIETVNSDNNGQAIWDTPASLSVGGHTVTARIRGYTANTQITVQKSNTALRIDVPALVYNDNFNVKGTLTDSLSQPVGGASVRLVWTVDGLEYSATEVTDSNGKVTFATQAPTRITQYTFQLFYNGGDNYSGCNTNIVSRTVSKESTILTVTTPLDYSTVYVSPLPSVEGTLTDDEGNALGGVPVRVSINGTSLVDHTDVNGAFVFSNFGTLNAGLNTIIVRFDGTSYFNGSVKFIDVYYVPYDEMTLSKTAGYDILSYADEQQTPNSQYCTVTAQLLNSQSPVGVSGIPVVFGVYKDNVLVGTETTVNTDSNGQASFTYRSQGRGDVEVRAVPDNRELLIQTYSIQDLWYYDTGATDKGHWDTSKLNGATYSCSSNGILLSSATNSNEQILGLDINYPSSDFSMECELVSFTNGSGYHADILGYGIGAIYYSTDNSIYMYDVSNWSGTNTNYSNRSISVGDTLKIIVSGTSISHYINNVLLGTKTKNSNYRGFSLHGTAYRNICVKNIKIKPL